MMYSAVIRIADTVSFQGVKNPAPRPSCKLWLCRDAFEAEGGWPQRNYFDAMELAEKRRGPTIWLEDWRDSIDPTLGVSCRGSRYSPDAYSRLIDH